MQQTGKLSDYLSIIRPGHWVKNIFMIPGIVVAIALLPPVDFNIVILNCLWGFVAACLIASANYALNEWLDAEFDRHHPEKSNRPAARGVLKASYVYLQYGLLAATGLAAAAMVNKLFLISTMLLFVSGVTYNVKPFRTKDRVYLDVISEALNNPIRLLMGWAIVSAITVPPLSLVLLYWAGGAFLMAAKRLSEYSLLVKEKGEKAAGKYRRSFEFYSIESLTISCFLYALTSAFGIAVFLIKYRAEFIITFPLIILLFAYYLHLGMQPSSVAQKPEKLHRDGRLMAIVAALIASFIACVFVDLPLVEKVIQSRFVEIRIE